MFSLLKSDADCRGIVFNEKVQNREDNQLGSVYPGALPSFGEVHPKGEPSNGG